MKCLGPVLVVYVLVTHNLVSSMPWETSTARYNHGGHITRIDNMNTNTKQNYIPISNKNLSLSDILLRSSAIVDSIASKQNFHRPNSVPRSARLPKNDTFYENISLMENEVVQSRKLASSKVKTATNNIVFRDTTVQNKTFRLKIASTSNKSKSNSNKTKTKVKGKTTSKPSRLSLTTSKSSTKRPTTSKLGFKKRTTIYHKNYPTTQKPTKRRPVTRVETVHKNYTELKVSSNKNRKPVIHKIISKWSDTLNVSEVKQTWQDVPQASPQPEIISYSPQFSINDALPSSPTVVDDALPTPSDAPADESSLSNPINQFNLDVLPSATKLADSGGGAGSDCPTVHISSAMLAPLAKQGCSDISVVLNSHFHQGNTPTQRVPTAENDPQLPIEAVEEDPLEEIGAPLETAAAEADPAPAPAADPPVAADPGAGGTGGAGQSGGGQGGGAPGGGFPSLPGLPEAPMLPEFDLKGMMDFLSWVGGGLSPLFNIFKNPWLYLIPITFFFMKGFVLVMAMFPWWIPALILLAGKDSKSHVSYYKHVHKPIYHPDGWFWNHNTKTWTNVHDMHKHYNHRVDSGRSFNFSIVPKLIEEFARKYQLFTENSQGWKRRKKNR